MGTITNKQVIRSEKRKNNSVTISNSIITDKNLKPLDKMVLIYILSEPNDAVLYQRSIANNLGVTLGTVIKTFKNLETFGFMVREKSNGNVDNYIIYENGYEKIQVLGNTPVKFEQPKISNINTVKKIVKNNLTKGKTGIKNAVKDTLGMFTMDSKPTEEKYSLDIVLYGFLKNSDSETKLKMLNVMSKMSHEINASDFCFTRNKLKESLTWLNVNQRLLKLTETQISDMQEEIDSFITETD